MVDENCNCVGIFLDDDEDTICDLIDNCVGIPNANQANNDNDNEGDACDDDDDNDGVLDADDNCVFEPNEDQLDNDEDGLGDRCDDDDDNDGVLDVDDNCPFDANADQADADEDGIGDVCDAVGIDENSLESKIYPNPVLDRLFIEVEENVELRMYDKMGRLIKSDFYKSNQTELDISNLRSGIYFLYLQGADGLSSYTPVIKL